MCLYQSDGLINGQHGLGVLHRAVAATLTHKPDMIRRQSHTNHKPKTSLYLYIEVEFLLDQHPKRTRPVRASDMKEGGNISTRATTHLTTSHHNSSHQFTSVHTSTSHINFTQSTSHINFTHQLHTLTRQFSNPPPYQSSLQCAVSLVKA